MTPKEINEEIALALGWVRLHDRKELPGGAIVEIESWADAGGRFMDVPDFCGDFNAINGAVRFKIAENKDFSMKRFCEHLIQSHGTFGAIVSTPLDRSRAFLRAMT